MSIRRSMPLIINFLLIFIKFPLDCRGYMVYNKYIRNIRGDGAVYARPGVPCMHGFSDPDGVAFIYAFRSRKSVNYF